MRPCAYVPHISTCAPMRQCIHALMCPCTHAPIRSCAHAPIRSCTHASKCSCTHAPMQVLSRPKSRFVVRAEAQACRADVKELRSTTSRAQNGMSWAGFGSGESCLYVCWVDRCVAVLRLQTRLVKHPTHRLKLDSSFLGSSVLKL